MYSLRPNEGTQIETDRTTPMPKSRAELHSTYWTKKGKSWSFETYQNI